jgi:hypothetical protein
MKKILIFSALIILIAISSCKKRNETEDNDDYIDYISGVKIRYTLAIVSGDNSISKSGINIKNARVSLVMNDSIHTKNVDEKGMVYFDNLFSGNTIVKVECEGYTTANLIVDLTIRDTTNIYDSENLRSASTIVTLFPLTGNNTATVSGNLYADTDLTTTGTEQVLQELLIRATINPAQIPDYINHSASGGILDFSYENATTTTISENGKYSLSVPSSLNGLEIFINADNFAADQRITGSDFVRKIFYADTETITAYPGSNIIKDLIFNP